MQKQRSEILWLYKQNRRLKQRTNKVGSNNRAPFLLNTRDFNLHTEYTKPYNIIGTPCKDVYSFSTKMRFKGFLTSFIIILQSCGKKKKKKQVGVGAAKQHSW